jgi:hypothetical protein
MIEKCDKTLGKIPCNGIKCYLCSLYIKPSTEIYSKCKETINTQWYSELTNVTPKQTDYDYPECNNLIQFDNVSLNPFSSTKIPVSNQSSLNTFLDILMRCNYDWVHKICYHHIKLNNDYIIIEDYWKCNESAINKTCTNISESPDWINIFSNYKKIDESKPTKSILTSLHSNKNIDLNIMKKNATIRFNIINYYLNYKKYKTINLQNKLKKKLKEIKIKKLLEKKTKKNSKIKIFLKKKGGTFEDQFIKKIIANNIFYYIGLSFYNYISSLGDAKIPTICKLPPHIKNEDDYYIEYLKIVFFNNKLMIEKYHKILHIKYDSDIVTKVKTYYIFYNLFRRFMIDKLQLDDTMFNFKQIFNIINIIYFQLKIASNKLKSSEKSLILSKNKSSRSSSSSSSNLSSSRISSNSSNSTSGFSSNSSNSTSGFSSNSTSGISSTRSN